MNKTFNSKLASYMEGLISEKRSSGFDFSLGESTLHSFDSFIIENDLDSGCLDEAAVRRWELLRPTENLNTRNSRLQVVRALATYMQALGLEVCHPLSHASQVRCVPYIPERGEIRKFFAFLDLQGNSGNPFPRMNIEYSILFRLYYCCGLRLNEAVMLKREDVDLDRGILYIRHSKGDKDRLVHLADDFRGLVQAYDAVMQQRFIRDRIWFIPGKSDDLHFSKTAIDKRFAQFWMAAFPDWKGRRPTVHCLRHAFVVHRMNDWVGAGNELSALMPYLSRYLGHSSISETMYYYHQLDAHSDSVRTFMESCDFVSREVARCR